MYYDLPIAIELVVWLPTILLENSGRAMKLHVGKVWLLQTRHEFKYTY